MIRDAGMTEFSGDAITAMLQSARDVPMLGIFGDENWTPNENHPGAFQRAGTNHWAVYRWDPDAKAPDGLEGQLRQRASSASTRCCAAPRSAVPSRADAHPTGATDSTRPSTTFDAARAAVNAGMSPGDAARALVATMTPEERLWCLDGDLPGLTGLMFIGRRTATTGRRSSAPSSSGSGCRASRSPTGLAGRCCPTAPASRCRWPGGRPGTRTSRSESVRRSVPSSEPRAPP